METNFRMPDQVNPLDLARIHPWDNALSPDEVTIESSTLGDLEQARIWQYLERYGICLFRMGAQTADDYVVQEVAKFLGNRR